jgi:hypothetical protein
VCAAEGQEVGAAKQQDEDASQSGNQVGVNVRDMTGQARYQ